MAAKEFDQRVNRLSVSIRFSAVSVWICCGLTLALFVTLWRYSLRPHPAWSIVTTVMIAVSVTFTAWFMCRLWLRKSRYLWSLGLLLLATLPIVWPGCFAWQIFNHGRQSESIPNTPIFRILVTYAMSYAEVEASLGYSRCLCGEHVELVDDGKTPNAAELVSQMDDHIRKMSELLGQPVPQGRSVWVRGPLLLNTAKAVGSFAICSESKDVQLEPLDHHEVAHTLIWRLCGPDHDPSGLLREGWAEFQSRSSEVMIRELKAIVDQGVQYTLMDLVSSEHYDSLDRAIYSHGGPLVTYLIERYGPGRFFELYRDVRRPTFLKDSERILGDSWESVETDFWKWLDDEAARRGMIIEPAPGTIILSDAVNSDEWKTVVRAYRESRAQISKWPKHFAIQKVYTLNGQREIQLEAVFDDGEVWAREREFDPVSTQLVAATSSHRIALYRENDGVQRLASESGAAKIDKHVSGYVQSIPRALLGMAELGQILPLDEDEQFYHARIISLERLEGHDSLWRLRGELRQANSTVYTFDIQLDSYLDWNVRRFTYRMPDNTEGIVEFEFTKFLGKTIATKRIGTGSGGYRDEQVVNLLDETVAGEVRNAVDAAARQGPTPEPKSLSETILQPLNLAIAWPVCGLSLWLIGRRRRREGTDNG